MTRPVAVIFERIGPYHHARLLAASRDMPLRAIEVFGKDLTYAWDEVEDKFSYDSETLFVDERDVGSRQAIRESLYQVLTKIDPDVVAVPGWSATYALAALNWCIDNKVPAVLMSDSTVDDAPRRWVVEKPKSRIVRLFAAALVAGQKHAVYLSALGMDQDRIFQGYDVVDNQHFSAGADAASETDRARLGLPKNFFLASSRFVAKKNISGVLDAFAGYRRKAGADAWSLVLLGDGGLRVDIENQIRSLELNDKVLLPGFRQYDELPAYFGLADVFVHASTVEQWGLVINEAMAAGLPVLVSNRCGCVPDLVEEGQNGFSFDPCDVEQLSGMMLRVAGDSSMRKAMGLRSRQIIGSWTPVRFADGLHAARDAAASQPPAPAGMIDQLILQVLCRR